MSKETRQAVSDEMLERAEMSDAVPSSLLVGYANRIKATEQAAQGWRCFHCDDFFTDWIQARNHFGHTPEDGAPVCKTERSTDSTVYHLKRQLELYQREDTELHRALHARDAEHRTALIREEEKGYARGLRDAQHSVLVRHAAELMVAAQCDDSDFANCSFRSLPDQLQSEIEKLAEHIERDRTSADT
ncbi:hypothetical protein [Hydrocarboniphaga effusa]|uniref:hypothetical protein n=1 Tax=Hydrocarboniphaga effusa TaxID=243629 RepID=UPI003BA8BB58